VAAPLDDKADALIADDSPAATLWQQLHDIRPPRR
jgi:hypothetical protein